ncbi:MAG: septum site-determining protein MinC [Pseudomonadota bacterium]|nr:septum site-determining protein MinC [Pseudomonadota bacterium]
MSASAGEVTIERTAAADLRADSFTLPVLRLLQSDMDAVSAVIAAKQQQAPEFFRNTPVIIDLQALEPGSGMVEFPLLVGVLRGAGMIPIGVRGATDALNASAQAMELAIFSGGQQEPEAPSPKKPEPAAEPATQADAPAAPSGQTMTITRPVRSGQRVYAAGGDLIVLSQVGSGAEVMADGNIHIYGALRGRAFAGVKGNQEARVFCHALYPELVAVAGRYVVSEKISADVLGKPVQIWLEGGRLQIERQPGI